MIRAACAVALALGASLAGAEPTAPAGPAQAGVASRPARAGDRGLLLLADGTTLSGLLVSSGAEGDVVELAGGERVRLAPGAVRGIATADAPGGAREGWVRLFRNDGSVVEGRLLSREGGTVRLETAPGERVEIAEADLKAEEDFGEQRVRRGGPPDAARARLFHLPTAFLLGAGELVVAVDATIQPSASYGVTSWLTVQLASALPVLQGQELSGNVTPSLRAGLPVLPWLRLAGGAQLYASSRGSIGHLLASATLGSEDLQLTLFGGPPPAWAGRFGRFGDVVGGAGGSWRFARFGTVVAEAWKGSRDGLGSVAYRHQLDRVAFEVGLAASTAGRATPFAALAWRVREGR
jgi:hypothetical protein